MLLRPDQLPSGCEVTLSFGMSGLAGGLLGRLAAGKIAGMVDTEAASLKAHAERTAR